jgi:hypothetical protein
LPNDTIMTVGLGTLEGIRRDGEAFLEALSREYYLALSGLKPTADLASIYRRFAKLHDPDTVAALREAFLSSSPGSDDHRSARILLGWLIDSVASQQLAELDERVIAWESTAVVDTGEGNMVPFQRISIDLGRLNDRAARLALEKARATIVGNELAPMKRDRLTRERDAIVEQGIGADYVQTFATLNAMDLDALVDQCRRFLRDTETLWHDVLRERLRPLGLAPGEATRADALFVLRANDFDAVFGRSDPLATIRRQVSDMGVDPAAGGRARYDTEEREGKRSRAFCQPVRVPDEVYIVHRPHGGASDYRVLLHEIGHALHFAFMRADLPFEARWLGDNSITESFAMLFDHNLLEAGWLRRYPELGMRDLESFLRFAGFEELHFLRRYCAKLVYERSLYSGELSWSALPELYTEVLSHATGFRYIEADAFVDVDPGFYAARYLRAWQLQALVRETLTERFDEDWWRNPRSGPWIIEQLFSPGQWEHADELAARVTTKTLTFAPVLRGIERLLGS